MSMISLTLVSLAEKTIPEKTQGVDFLLFYLDKETQPIEDRDFELLNGFIRREAVMIRETLRKPHSPRGKIEGIAYADKLFALLNRLYSAEEGDMRDLPDDMIETEETLNELYRMNDQLQIEIENAFKRKKIDKLSVDRILSFARALETEYEKGALYEELDLNDDRIDDFTPDAKETMAQYIEDEIGRYLSIGEPDEEVLLVLEYAVDVVRYFPRSGTPALLRQSLQAGHPNVMFHALASLLYLGEKPDEDAVRTLADDPAYASITYWLLKDNEASAFFPEDKRDPVYLAKSDLIHWLSYPSELGKAPDGIEYVGKVKKLFKKDPYYVFRFRSDSSTLPDEKKGKWLVGWSHPDGCTTYYRFRLYEEYEKETEKKTLNNIKRRLL